MKSTKKIVCILLSVLMLITCISASFTVNASTGTLSKYYATNPDNKVGIKKTISVDGDISDWDSSMLIAQAAANDDPRVYRDSSMHEIAMDDYALYACWDDSNLYLMWEMTNVQDVVGGPDDTFPLSQGNIWIYDMPYYLAFDIDPTAGGDGTFTSGATMWDSGITFDTDVDVLMANSVNFWNGPFVYKANSNGLFDYGTAQNINSTAKLKWGNGILSKNIYGINCGYGHYNNRLVGDMCSDDADWVEFNSLGHNSDKYDMHWELSIPLNSLGITSSYIEENGIGVCKISTFGTSGMDCLPYDLSMNDNADKEYSKEPSGSQEKEDEDHITAPFARIGKLSGGTPTPPPSTTKPTVAPTTAKPTVAATTAKPTVAPTTAKPTTVSNLSVKATSNLFPEKNLTVSKDAKTVTVNYDLKSAMMLVNGQAKLSYDPSVLRFDPAKNKDIMPYVSDETVNSLDSYLRMIFTNVENLYDFTSLKSFVNVTFDVLSTGNTTVDLKVEELSVGYFNNSGVLEYKNAVVRGAIIDLSKTPGFTTSSLSGTTSIVADQVSTTVKPAESTQPQSGLTVKSTSNLFGSASKTYDKNTKQLTVTYEMSSNFKLLDAQWVLKYDTSKLAYSSSNTPTSVMPNISTSQVNLPEEGRLKGTFSNPNLYDFTEEKSFITVVFDVLGTGTADVNLDVQYLGLAYYDSAKDTHKAYLVDRSIVNDVTKVPGFEAATYSVKTVFDAEPEYLFGDVDLDGELTIKDATLIQQYIVELKPLTYLQKKIANVNGDDEINVMDATYIQMIIVELIKI